LSSRGVNDQSFDPKPSQSGEYTTSSFVEVLSSTAMTSARVFLDLLHTDSLTREGLAEVGLQRPHADAPAPCDGDGAVVEGVLELR